METEIERHYLKYVIEGWWDELDNSDLTTRMCAWNRFHGALIVASDELADELRLLLDVALQRENDRAASKEQP